LHFPVSKKTHSLFGQNFRISRFYQVKQAIILLGILLAFRSHCSAQGDRLPLPSNFEDSVRVVLENTRSIDATVIGAGFFGIWNQLGIDHQMIIKKQTFRMRKKKFPLKTHLVNYFGAIVNAINIEKADPATLTDFLKVTEKVIEKSNPRQAQDFFAASRAFFEHHAIHYDKSFRLYAQEDTYKFDYIENNPEPALSWDQPDTASTTDTYEDPPPLEEPSDSGFADDQDATASNSDSFLPSYFLAAAPPVIEGPVIRFDKVTLNFATTYDSVHLRNTKGTYSMYQSIFVGEEGSFDWTSAGFGPDSVMCNMTTYNFSVR